MPLSVFVLIVFMFLSVNPTKLNIEAYNGAVLSDQRKVQRVDVDRVSFKIHKKDRQT